MTYATLSFLVLLPLAAMAAAAYSLAVTRREALREDAATVHVETMSDGAPARAVTEAGKGSGGKPLALILVALAFLACLQLDLAFWVDTDDAPITFRYAENLAEGRGFVYNEGERILGTSTPLFVLALAALRIAGIPVETGALLISLASLVVLLSLIFRCGRSLGSAAPAFLAAALICTEAPFLVYTTQGMETTCYLALIVGTFVCHMEGRERLAAAVAALCVLMRLDGLAVPAALAASYFAERRRPSRSAVLIFVAVCAPWFLYSWLYFGHLLPQSMLAKLAHTKYSGRWWMLRSLFLEDNLLFVPFGLLGAAWIFSGDGAARRAVLPAWLVLYAGAFTVIGIDAYPWYRIPPIPILALLAGVGVHGAAAALFRAGPGGHRRLALAVVMAAAIPWGASRCLAYRSSLGAYSEQLRVWERPRIAAAEWLRDHALPGSSVATAGIGHIGWISGLRVFDTSGLVSPGLLGTFDVGRDKPDFVVGHDEGPPPGGLFRVDHPDYQLAESVTVEPTLIYRIYKRKDTRLR